VETRGGIRHVARDMASDVGPRGGGGEGVGVRNEARGSETKQRAPKRREGCLLGYWVVSGCVLGTREVGKSGGKRGAR
jgi:hypothetical protein